MPGPAIWQAEPDLWSAVAGEVGWAYDRVGELPAVRAANLRWLAGYRHPRYACAAGDGGAGRGVRRAVPAAGGGGQGRRPGRCAAALFAM
jgi:hypothetical protein